MRRSALLLLAAAVSVIPPLYLFAQTPQPSVRLVVPGPQPLGHDKVSVLFDRINAGDKIEIESLHAALIGPHYTLRAYAARLLGEAGDATSVPLLIHALTDQSVYEGADVPDAGMVTVRYWANLSLIKLTGRNFDFVWNSPMEQQNAAVLRWLTWSQTIHIETNQRR